MLTILGEPLQKQIGFCSHLLITAILKCYLNLLLLFLEFLLDSVSPVELLGGSKDYIAHESVTPGSSVQCPYTDADVSFSFHLLSFLRKAHRSTSWWPCPSDISLADSRSQSSWAQQAASGSLHWDRLSPAHTHTTSVFVYLLDVCMINSWYLQRFFSTGCGIREYTLPSVKKGTAKCTSCNAGIIKKPA